MIPLESDFSKKRRDRIMDLKLTDIEANAVKHSMEAYMKDLQKSEKKEKGLEFEKDAVKRVLEKIQTSSGASGT